MKKLKGSRLSRILSNVDFGFSVRDLIWKRTFYYQV